MALTKVSYSLIKGDTVSVVDFGADPTGTTDATTVIQSAIDSGAKAVYFPAGTYKITSQIDLVSDQVLFGDGQEQSIISVSGSAWGSTKALSGEDTGNVEIRNLGFVGDSHASTAAVVYLENTGAAKLVGPKITNCSFTSLNGYSVVSVQGPITGSDWTTTTEPSSSWNTFENTIISGLLFTDCTVPNTTYAYPSLGLSGLRRFNVDGVIIDNCQERGISAGYFTDGVISNCNVQTTTNGNASSNPHAIYIRTTKRFSVSNCAVNLNTTLGSACVRLSRGAYYGTISNIQASTASTGSGKGFMSHGGNDIVLSGCHFVTSGVACQIAGHGSVSGTDGTSDSSFADANNIIVSSSYFETTGDVQALYASAVAVGTGEPRQPYMKNVRIEGCQFVNDTTDTDQIALLDIGDQAIVSDCKFYGDNPQAAVLLDRDNRIDSADFAWHFENCEFTSGTETTTSDAGATHGDAFTTVGILYDNNVTSNELYVSDCRFKNWFTGLGINNGQIVNIEGSTFTNVFSGIRTEGASSSKVYISRNSFYVSPANGARIHFGVANTTATDYSYVTHNVMRAVSGRGLLFDSVTYKLLYVSHNNYDGSSKFIQDCPNVATIKVTHNLVTESAATTLPANPIDQFNYGIT